ncbi:hypothetical protein D3C71_1916120 [compost metagenome]
MIDFAVFVTFGAFQRPLAKDQVLINMIIRNNRLVLSDVVVHGIFKLLIPVAEKEHFKLEAPVVHVLIELVQERILLHNFFDDRKLQFTGQHRGKCCFTGSDRAFHCYKGCMFH